MPTTPVLGLPYPAATDPADVPTDMQELANRLEAVIPTRIYDQTLATDAANFDIPSIPQTFVNLRMLLWLRTTEASLLTVCGLRFNGDVAASYAFQQMRGSMTTADAVLLFNEVYAKVANVPGANATAARYAAVTVDIPNYRTSHEKATLANWFRYADATNADAGLVGALWANSAAISRITVVPGAALFAAGSRATLYGQ
jgi:hypothetical protein